MNKELTCGQAVAPTAEEIIKSKLIVPTVGRKVWYRPSKNDLAGPNAMMVKTGDPLDATIIAVWNDRLVNVLVTDIMGKTYPKTSIKLLQYGDDTPKDLEGNNAGFYVEWMPYQQGK